MTSKTGQVLCVLLKDPCGFIPSVDNARRRFLGSLPNEGYLQSIYFHCGESAGCRSFPSFILSSLCQVRFFASSRELNIRLNLGIMGKYQRTLAGTPGFLYLGVLQSGLGHLLCPANSL